LKVFASALTRVGGGLPEELVSPAPVRIGRIEANYVMASVLTGSNASLHACAACF